MDYYLGQLEDITGEKNLKVKIQGDSAATKWLNVTEEQAAFILNYLSEQNK